jgi:hypothetical protein
VADCRVWRNARASGAQLGNRLSLPGLEMFGQCLVSNRVIPNPMLSVKVYRLEVRPARLVWEPSSMTKPLDFP